MECWRCARDRRTYSAEIERIRRALPSDTEASSAEAPSAEALALRLAQAKATLESTLALARQVHEDERQRLTSERDRLQAELDTLQKADLETRAAAAAAERQRNEARANLLAARTWILAVRAPHGIQRTAHAVAFCFHRPRVRVITLVLRPGERVSFFT